MTNPFASSPFGTPAAAPTAAPASPFGAAPVAQTEVVVNEAPVTEDGEGKAKKPRKARTFTNRRKTADEVKYILANYKDQSTSKIAEHLNLTSQQVSRTILDARKAYLARAETLPPEKAEQIKNWVETYLPSKASEFGKPGKRGNLVDNMFDDIFGSIL